MSEQENIQRAKEGIAMLNAHDFESYVQQRIDESYEGEAETAQGGVHGRAGLLEQLNMALAGFPDLHIEVEQVLASGDHVVTRLRLSGTHKGTFAGIPPTHKTASWGVCGVSEVRNGKVIRGRLYVDNVSLLQQIGAMPTPRAAAG